MRSPAAARRSTTRTVPSTDGPSSSLVTRKAIEPRGDARSARKASVAVTNAASELFMSAAPRPNSRPSRSTGANGSERHSASGPVGTTSVWPAKHTSGRASPRRAQRFVTPLRTIVSQRKPSGSSRAAISAWHPASSGVSERRAISSRTRASVGYAAVSIGRCYQTPPQVRGGRTSAWFRKRKRRAPPRPARTRQCAIDPR